MSARAEKTLPLPPTTAQVELRPPKDIRLGWNLALQKYESNKSGIFHQDNIA